MTKSYLINNVSELIDFYGNKKSSINYFISYSADLNNSVKSSIDDVVRELSTKILREMNITRKKELTYLELKFPELDASKDLFNKFFDSAAIHTRLYKNFEGCQVIDISSCVNEMNSEQFKELLGYFSKNSKSRFILKAKVLDENVSNKVLAILSTVLEIQHVLLKECSEDKVMENIVKTFECNNVLLDLEARSVLNDWLVNGKINVFLNQPNGLKLLCKAIIANRNIIGGDGTFINQKIVLSRQDLIYFELNFLIYIDNEEQFQIRKIGF